MTIHQLCTAYYNRGRGVSEMTQVVHNFETGQDICFFHLYNFLLNSRNFNSHLL